MAEKHYAITMFGLGIVADPFTPRGEIRIHPEAYHKIWLAFRGNEEPPDWLLKIERAFNE